MTTSVYRWERESDSHLRPHVAAVSAPERRKACAACGALGLLVDELVLAVVVEDHVLRSGR